MTFSSLECRTGGPLSSDFLWVLNPGLINSNKNAKRMSVIRFGGRVDEVFAYCLMCLGRGCS